MFACSTVPFSKWNDQVIWQLLQASLRSRFQECKKELNEAAAWLRLQKAVDEPCSWYLMDCHGCLMRHRTGPPMQITPLKQQVWWVCVVWLGLHMHIISCISCSEQEMTMRTTLGRSAVQRRSTRLRTRSGDSGFNRMHVFVKEQIYVVGRRTTLR